MRICPRLDEKPERGHVFLLTPLSPSRSTPGCRVNGVERTRIGTPTEKQSDGLNPRVISSPGKHGSIPCGIAGIDVATQIDQPVDQSQFSVIGGIVESRASTDKGSATFVWPGPLPSRQFGTFFKQGQRLSFPLRIVPGGQEPEKQFVFAHDWIMPERAATVEWNSGSHRAGDPPHRADESLETGEPASRRPEGSLSRGRLHRPLSGSLRHRPLSGLS